MGDGPVNALDRALRKALTRFYPSLEEMKLIDYKVRVLSGERGTEAKVRVLVESTDGRNQWSTVGVSINIIEASWQALIDSVNFKLMKYENKDSLIAICIELKESRQVHSAWKNCCSHWDLSSPAWRWAIWFQKMAAGGSLSLPVPIGDLRKILQKIGLLFFMPISFLSAVWSVSFHDIRVILLPVVGFCALMLGGLLGLGLARLLKIPTRQKGVLYCCGSFTNIGSIGGLVCYLFLGEVGFALVTIYKMSEEITYYTIGFPIARFYSGAADDKQSL